MSKKKAQANRTNEIAETEKKINNLQGQLANAYKHLKFLKWNSQLQISDHAVVRYLQRCDRIDFDRIKNTLITPQLLNLFKQFGDGEYPVNDTGLRVIIRDGVIVTVII